MWQRDVQNISNLLLEDTSPTMSDEDQKKLADFFVDLVVKIEKGDA
jgi:hypothetical protein